MSSRLQRGKKNTMHNSELKIGGLTVEILRKGNLKNLYIEVVPPDGKVLVKSPITVEDEEIRLHILKKLPEITRVRDRMRSQERQTKREFVSGEAHYIWGKAYRLQVIYEGKKASVVKTPNKLVLTVPEGTTAEGRERVLTEWYRDELKRVLASVAGRCEKRTGITANEYRVKNMRTKWGTCNIEKRRIWINLQLAKKPVECLEYVVTHELVHLVEKNHTNRFHALVSEYYPTWQEAKKILNSMPLDYMESEYEEQ